MISVASAKNIIQSNAMAAAPVMLPLEAAGGLALGAAIYARLDIPAFPQSSMDGYAIRYADLQEHSSLPISGEVAAGAKEAPSLPAGKAARIFTGAPVPPGADTVVMQEKVKVENGRIFIEDDKLRTGLNVRPAGAEIKTGALALEAGAILTPAAIGFLAGIGVTELSVIPSPKLAVIVTGNELQQPGEPLGYGQVYESNSYALRSVLKQLGFGAPSIYQASDDIETLQNILEEALEKHDMVLLTGGVSVGDYDFVTRAAAHCAVETLFHRIKQRPGKPLYFGKKENKLVFGLPGNPASVLTCFYQYVTVALSGLTKRKLMPAPQWLPLESDYQKDPGLAHFLRATYDGASVKPFLAQESFRMYAFARANCLIEIEEEATAIKAGSLVKTYLLPT
jgi:molybdopterin molybdotransferase